MTEAKTRYRAAMAITEVTRNAEGNTYELRVDGEIVGRADYRLEGMRMLFTHTEVDEDRQGQGHGNELAKGALDDAKANGFTIVAVCSFIQAYAKRHPEYLNTEGER